MRTWTTLCCCVFLIAFFVGTSWPVYADDWSGLSPEIRLIGLQEPNWGYRQELVVRESQVTMDCDALAISIIYHAEINTNTVVLRIDEFPSVQFTRTPFSISAGDGSIKATQFSAELNAAQIAVHPTITLSIGKNMGSLSGTETDAFMRITVTCRNLTKATFLLDGADADYPDFKATSDDSIYEMNHLSNHPKSFKVTFSRPVIPSTVETCIESGIYRNDGKCAFTWFSPTHLDLRLDALRDGEYYGFNLNRAVDDGGKPINGMLGFYAHTPCSIGAIVIDNGFEHLHRAFHDKVYMTYPMPMIENSVILNDGVNSYCYSLDDRLMKPIEVPGHPVDPGLGWLDANRMLIAGLDGVYIQNLGNPERLRIYQEDGIYFHSVFLSPSKKRFVLTRYTDEGFPFLVLDDQGSVLFRSDTSTLIRGAERPFLIPKPVWLNEHTLVFESSDQSVIRKRLDTDTGIVSEFQLDCEYLIPSRDSRFAVYAKQADRPPNAPVSEDPPPMILFMLRDGHEVELPGDWEHPVKECYEVDADQIVFNHGKDIWLIDLSTSEAKCLGKDKGVIIGLSSDKKKVFYNTFAEYIYYDC